MKHLKMKYLKKQICAIAAIFFIFLVVYVILNISFEREERTEGIAGRAFFQTIAQASRDIGSEEVFCFDHDKLSMNSYVKPTTVVVAQADKSEKIQDTCLDSNVLVEVLCDDTTARGYSTEIVDCRTLGNALKCIADGNGIGYCG